MSGSTLVNGAVVVALVIYLIARKLAWVPLRTTDKELWYGPAILAAIGGYQVWRTVHEEHVGASSVVLLAVGLVAAVACGTVMGRMTQLERRGDGVFQRLGPVGVVLWAVAEGIDLGLEGLGHAWGAEVGGAMMLTLGANLLCQALVLTARMGGRMPWGSVTEHS